MKTTRMLCATAIALSAAACAQKVAPPPPPTVSVMAGQTQGGGFGEEVVTVSATVQAIDHETRMVTLLGPEGATFTFRASDLVKNLDQVQVGDVVSAAFYEAIAYDVKKKGTAEPGVAGAADVVEAPVGSMPAGVEASAVTVTATITAIDKSKPSITLKGPEGKVVTVRVKDPSRLEGVKVGDLVELTYTHAIGISVDKAPKKA